MGKLCHSKKNPWLKKNFLIISELKKINLRDVAENREEW